MELKPVVIEETEEAGERLNRTSMELKPRTHHGIHHAPLGLNRTSMELKRHAIRESIHGNAFESHLYGIETGEEFGSLCRCYRLNRTSMELKQWSAILERVAPKV